MTKGRTRMSRSVYKILTADQWASFQAEGRFAGSADDLRDGFIHLSTHAQVDGVIQRYFSAVRPLYVAEFSNPAFTGQLRWEAATSGDRYPHLYNASLLLADVAAVVER